MSIFIKWSNDLDISKNITQLIGKTPLVELSNYQRQKSLQATLVGKLESFNPGGSVKDRIAIAMIEDAEKNGVLKSGMVIIEPTSGNTGIGLAMVAAAKGYKLVLVMPDTMSVERRSILKAYGAVLELTDGTKGMIGAIHRAEQLAKTVPNGFMPRQFENPANPTVHFDTTGPEIWDDTHGKIDIFVSGVGTGGTISGAGKYLKYKNPNIKVVAVEPTDSPMLSKGKAGPHKIQGIGAGFVPKTLDTAIYDDIVAVTNDSAFETSREISRTDGILVGISSGAAIWAATELAKQEANAGKVIVIVLPDSGERYLSTGIFG